MIGRVIKNTLQRETDQAFRIGGEEFVVLIQTVHQDEVGMIAEKLRKAVLAERMEHVKNDPYGVISISVGGIVLSPPSQGHPFPSLDTLFRKADRALYQAKAEGRNRVIMA